MKQTEQERWREYTEERKRLDRLGLSPDEYAKAVRELARKCGV